MSASNYNLAVQLTAPGIAGLAVVRLSGPLVDAFLAGHFSGKPIAGKCAYGRIVRARDDGEAIDDVIVVRLHGVVGPARADVSLHGGSYIVQAFLDLAAAAGFAVVVGRIADRTGGFGAVFVIVGFLPFVGLGAILLGWGRDKPETVGGEPA